MKTIIFITFGLLIISWLSFYIKGKRFALRSRLRKADAIIVLAGTRGNLKFIDSKISTAVHLYHKEWAPYIICSGRFSAKVASSKEPNLITLVELQEAVMNRRIQEKDILKATKTWDIDLGAKYMQDKALAMGIPAGNILVENESLHTRENAEYTLALLKKLNLTSIILVTSAFHQLRTYLTFSKVFSPHNIQIINYADFNGWNSATWFLSKANRKLVDSEAERIKLYKKKGHL